MASSGPRGTEDDVQQQREICKEFCTVLWVLTCTCASWMQPALHCCSFATQEHPNPPLCCWWAVQPSGTGAWCHWCVLARTLGRFWGSLELQLSSEELQVGIGQYLLCASVPSLLVLPWKHCSCTLRFRDRILQSAEQDTYFTGHLFQWTFRTMFL